MDIFSNLLEQLSLLFDRAGTGNAPWQFWAALLLLVTGLVLLEIFYRYVQQRIQAMLEARDLDPGKWGLKALLPSFRLAGTALLLRMAEGLLIISPELAKLLHAVEAIFMALAALLVMYNLISRIDQLRTALPIRLQDEISEQHIVKLKKVLRLLIMASVTAGFIYSQQSFFPKWLVELSFWRYLFALTVFTAIYAAVRMINTTLLRMVVVLKETGEGAQLCLVLQSTIWPLRLLLSALTVFALKEIFKLSEFLSRVAEIAISVLGTLAVVVFLYRIVEVMVYELGKFSQREDNLLDESFAQMIRMIARVVVVLFGGIYLIQSISGKPLSALLAGLGIGGLAVALAAQDTLKNFFGSIMIMLDRPFKVGQRVTVDGYDGNVEEIGFRSTRVRTLTGHLVTVPNEKMAASNIENIGQRPSIRRLANITITYDTPLEKIEKALEIIKEILDNHEGMHPDFPPRVFFNEFNSTSLNILMIYWYHPPEYWKYMEFTEKVNLKIMRAFEAEGIEFAFPTTTTYLAQDDRRPLSINIDKEFQKQ